MGLLCALVIFATPTKALPEVTAYADVTVRYQAGAVTVLSVRPGRFKKPTTLPRFRGRFTLIVAKGKQNLAEIEFDFPLLSATESEDATEEARALAEKLRKGVTASTAVRVPLPDGADGLLVYDGAQRKAVSATVPLGAPVHGPRAP